MRIWYVNKLLPKNQYPLALLIASQWYVSLLPFAIPRPFYHPSTRWGSCSPLAPLALLPATSRLQFRVNLHKNTVQSCCCRCCWFSRKAAIVRAPYLSAICVLAISLGTCCISVMTERGGAHSFWPSWTRCMMCWQNVSSTRRRRMRFCTSNRWRIHVYMCARLCVCVCVRTSTFDAAQ